MIDVEAVTRILVDYHSTQWVMICGALAPVGPTEQGTSTEGMYAAIAMNDFYCFSCTDMRCGTSKRKEERSGKERRSESLIILATPYHGHSIFEMRDVLHLC